VSATTTVDRIQTAIRALNGNAKITATISGATATLKGMTDTGVNA
jgi:hypothetical protein